MYGRGSALVRGALLPMGVALILVSSACSSASTPIATSSSVSSTPAPSPSAAASTGSVSGSAAIAPITQPSVPISVSAPGSAVPQSAVPESAAPESAAPESGLSPATEPSGTEPSAPESAATGPTEPATGTPTGVPSSTRLPVATVDTTGADARSALAAMNRSLLTAAQVGAGFVKKPTPAPDTSQKLACGGDSALALYPNALQTELIATKGENVQFQESLYLFLDDATSAKAFQADVKGLDCAKGTVSGTPVTIGRSKDVTASVGGSKALAWEITLDGATGVLVAVNSGSVFLGFSFLVATGTDPGTLPNPLTLARTATAKMLAGGLG